MTVTRGLALFFLASGFVAGAQPRDAHAVVLASQSSCQLAISKSTSAYARSIVKTMTGCRFAELSGREPGACSSVKTLDALAKAQAKLGKITKPCESLTDEDLASSRPLGLSLTPHAALLGDLGGAVDAYVGAIDEVRYPSPPSGSPPSDDALKCQKVLDKGAASYLTAVLKNAGACQNNEDRGKSKSGEVFRIVESCLETTAPKLDAAVVKAKKDVVKFCSDTALSELGDCPSLTAAEREADAVADCILDTVKKAAAAVLAATHGRDYPRVIGRLSTRLPGLTHTIAAAGAAVVALDDDGTVVGSATADATGHVDIPVPPLGRVTLCLDRDTNRACSAETVDVGIEPVYFGDRDIDFPHGAGEVPIGGRMIRADGRPCFEASTAPAFALRGSVRIAPTGLPPSGESVQVSPDGEFAVGVPLGAPSSLHAACGSEVVVVDLGPAPDPSMPVVVQTTNTAPTNGAIAMTSSGGTPVTDPSTVHPGDTIDLHASFDDTEALAYRWEVTRGNGTLHVSGVPDGDERFASGPDVQWQVGDESPIQQVALWASDGKGGIESLVATLGPIDVGPVLVGPCLTIPKLQKVLCAQGFGGTVPEPAGGRTEFLTYRYRNASHNSSGDACAYYNIVDPDCIDMNCDGAVDAGTDPMGKCKRTTLGGWWQKNGFDATGLGPDVVTAWYLNSNDLGFGREMHCRVTSWSSIIAERPVQAPTSAARFLENLRSDIAASPQAVQFAKLFNLYPSTVACYVVNYTTDYCFNYPTNDPQNADLAYQGQQAFVANPSVDPLHAYGTVAMEFGPVEGFSDVGPITKFFVYDGHLASGKRLTAANLDGCGPKSVPEVCMHCHGGYWPGDWSQGATLDTMIAGLPGALVGIDATDTASTDAGYLLRRSILEKLTREEYGFSSFEPFDIDTFQFPAAAPLATQAANLRKLNQLVLYTKPVDPIRDLVKGWYGNNLISGTFGPWRPSAWNDDGGQPGDESDLYDQVYARACRVCHAAHYSFSSWGSFPPSSRICKNGSGLGGGTPTMPHAKLTYLNLWKSDFPQALTMPTVEAWYTASEGGFTSCD